jgi:hypothetical protein
MSEGGSNPSIRDAVTWIASRSLSSGAHSRDPLARNDVEEQALEFHPHPRDANAVPVFARAQISSSFSLTGYLPLSSSARLPTLSMRSGESARSLACNTQATPINSPAT